MLMAEAICRRIVQIGNVETCHADHHFQPAPARHAGQLAWIVVRLPS